MPTLDVRNGFGQKSGVMEGRGWGIMDTRGGSDGEYEEVGRRGGSAACDDFVSVTQKSSVSKWETYFPS